MAAEAGPRAGPTPGGRLGELEGVDHVESAGFADRAGDVYAIAGDQLASSGAHLLTIVGGEA